MAEKNLYYFAYGSNMNPKRMKDRKINFLHLEPAVLENHKLVFNKRLQKPRNGKFVAAANIEPAEGERVEGVLYLISKEEIFKLDIYEGYPDHYDRTTVEVKTKRGETVKAITYIAQPEVIEEGLKPCRSYLNHLLEACRRGFLSEDYCKKLKEAQTEDC